MPEAKRRVAPVVAAFAALLVVTLAGVLFFFDPLTAGDTSFVAVHPAVGLLVYAGLSIALFVWSTNQTNSAYKGAFLLAAPQIILVIDLTLRGSRGVTTALAGTTRLAFTWLVVAYTYSRLTR